ncbi:hypothetical protein EC912_108150 [Luteibacter rhizovicinus]|uniref:Uncharacterized protein n=1 Tax=Luteibacter rhizovicinus TaxID=242606 RepID=A0A4R3YIW5_9GAMM|nr:hypothetical protein [Luteibacter rhizovicinus]TCV92156.1 hypothetical protein EC912_108150 [Luteibacter rhizovicinus]
MSNTTSELTLSPAYRQSQRALSAWIEQTGAGARRHAFTARSSLSGLAAFERGRLARWIAWLCIAGESRGEPSLIGRLRRLDGALYTSVYEALDRLPGAVTGIAGRVRLSA